MACRSFSILGWLPGCLRPAALLALLWLLVPGCRWGRAVVYNYANITDHRIFPARPLRAASSPARLPEALDGATLPDSVRYRGRAYTLEAFLEAHSTLAFLVLRRDTLRYEAYFKGWQSSDLANVFSVSKSVLSMLVGIALEEGYLGSEEDAVLQYLPELAGQGFEGLRLRHLLQMTAALDFDEGYRNPFADAAAFYYGRRLRRRSLALRVPDSAGRRFVYQSGVSQLLGLVLERALPEGVTLTSYLQRKLWTPLGMAYDASWSIDQKGPEAIEKTFCCLNLRARDLLRLGRLYLDEGRWGGRRLVPEAWVRRSTALDSADGSAWYYQYQWWLPSRRGDFMARGILGQYVYIDPARELVMVRLGRKEGGIDWPVFFQELSLE
jgi:CubicO group peptidase (beta-lactamase class C family)